MNLNGYAVEANPPLEVSVPPYGGEPAWSADCRELGVLPEIQES